MYEKTSAEMIRFGWFCNSMKADSIGGKYGKEHMWDICIGEGEYVCML